MKIENNHIPMISTEITQAIFSISKCYPYIHNQLSEQHIHALGKRFSMMADAYILIAQLFHREPSSEEEMNRFNIYLNSYYMNIFGSLENLAWLIYFERIYPGIKLNKKYIYLFGEKFLQVCEKHGFLLKELNDTYLSWVRELKKKRDPIAHQVPLYIPYRVLRNENQRNEYNEIILLANRKAKEHDFDEYMNLMYKSRKVGEFVPMIWLVDSEEELLRFIDFRSIINSDIQKLIEILYNITKQLFPNNYEET